MFADDDRIRLRHMLDAARIAVRAAAGRRRVDLDDEEDLFVHGLVRLVTTLARRRTASATLLALRSRTSPGRTW
jgi:hypothetical protein